MVESCRFVDLFFLFQSHLDKHLKGVFLEFETPIQKETQSGMGETICQKDHLAKRARQPAGRVAVVFGGISFVGGTYFFEVTIRQTAAGKASSILKAFKNKNRDEKKEFHLRPLHGPGELTLTSHDLHS